MKNYPQEAINARSIFGAPIDYSTLNLAEIQQAIDSIEANTPNGDNRASQTLVEIYDQTGIDSQQLEPLLPSLNSKIRLGHGFFEKRRVLIELARAFRREPNDFAAFSAIFNLYGISIFSIAEIVKNHPKLERFGLNQAEVLEKIDFVRNATQENFIVAIPLIIGFSEQLSDFSIGCKDLDYLEKTELLSTGAPYLQRFGLNFSGFDASVSIENEWGYGAVIDICCSNGGSIAISFDCHENDRSARKLARPLLQVVRELINLALRADARGMGRLIKNSIVEFEDNQEVSLKEIRRLRKILKEVAEIAHG